MKRRTLLAFEAILLGVFVLGCIPKADSKTQSKNSSDLIAFSYLQDGFLFDDMAVAGRRAVYTVQPDGNGLTRLVKDLDNSDKPLWSPDGTRLAFVSKDGASGLSSLYTIDVTSGKIDYFANSGFQVDHFTWSPDGKTIVISAYILITQSPIQYQEYGVYLASLTDRNPRVLLQVDGVVDGLMWSPTAMDKILVIFANEKERSFYVIDTAGNSRKLVTADSPGFTPFAWDPTGQQIAYSGSCEAGKNTQVHIINVDGTSERVIDNSGPCAGSLAWSPDGTLLAFNNGPQTGPCTRNYITDFKTGNARWALPEGLCALLPTWSPDGRYLAFLAETDQVRQKGYALYTFSLETQELRQILSQGVAPSAPTWKP
jgi:Tol biopolymer transport system component